MNMRVCVKLDNLDKASVKCGEGLNLSARSCWRVHIDRMGSMVLYDICFSFGRHERHTEPLDDRILADDRPSIMIVLFAPLKDLRKPITNPFG